MTTQEQIIAAAKEAGIKRAFVCANPDECPDDDACCYSQKPDGYWVKDEQLERFYAIAFEAGRVAERKECEKLATINRADLTAEAIRARGDTK